MPLGAIKIWLNLQALCLLCMSKRIPFKYNDTRGFTVIFLFYLLLLLVLLYNAVYFRVCVFIYLFLFSPKVMLCKLPCSLHSGSWQGHALQTESFFNVSNLSLCLFLLILLLSYYTTNRYMWLKGKPNALLPPNKQKFVSVFRRHMQLKV